jgi:hypothetical protein
VLLPIEFTIDDLNTNPMSVNLNYSAVISYNGRYTGRLIPNLDAKDLFIESEYKPEKLLWQKTFHSLEDIVSNVAEDTGNSYEWIERKFGSWIYVGLNEDEFDTDLDRLLVELMLLESNNQSTEQISAFINQNYPQWNREVYVPGIYGLTPDREHPCMALLLRYLQDGNWCAELMAPTEEQYEWFRDGYCEADTFEQLYYSIAWNVCFSDWIRSAYQSLEELQKVMINDDPRWKSIFLLDTSISS